MSPIALVLADAGTSPSPTGSHSYSTNVIVLVENLSFVKQVQILGRNNISGSWDLHPLTFSSSAPGTGELWTTQLGDPPIDQFVVQYVVLGETFWDNNSGFNYLLDPHGAGERDGIGSVALAVNVVSFGRGGVDGGDPKGDVLGRNLAFSKQVGIVFSVDNWAPVHSALGIFMETFPPLNAPNQPNSERWHISVPVGGAMERVLASLPGLQQKPAGKPYSRRREQTPRPCPRCGQGAAGCEASTEDKNQQREAWISEARPTALRARLQSKNRGAPRGGNDGLMESMEDRTIELSALPPFPQSLEITKCG